MVYKWLKKQLLGGWLPAVCRLCGAAGDEDRDLCAACRADLPWLGIACRRCARPLAADGLTCGPCLRRPPPYQRVRAPLRYQFPADTLVQEFKFREQLASGRLLADLMADAIGGPPLPELLLPVPLHPRRLRRRGFNQAWELARLLSRRLAIPADPHLLARIIDTPAQHELPARQRRGNVRRAFQLTGPLKATRLAVVDDVLTTGHTAAEITRVLRRAGAEQVEIWVATRA